ncbi:MAG: hypothetical protein ACM3VW_04800, partial [Bacteroidota bacterium]
MRKSDLLRSLEGAQRCGPKCHLGLTPALWLCSLLMVTMPANAGVLPQSLFTTNWYTVLIMGNRSGYSCQTLRDSGQGVETVEQTLLQIRMDAQTLRISRQERRLYDSNLRLTSIENEA